MEMEGEEGAGDKEGGAVGVRTGATEGVARVDDWPSGEGAKPWNALVAVRRRWSTPKSTGGGVGVPGDGCVWREDEGYWIVGETTKPICAAITEGVNVGKDDEDEDDGDDK